MLKYFRVLEMMQLNEIEESEDGEATDLVSYSNLS